MFNRIISQGECESYDEAGYEQQIIHGRNNVIFKECLVMMLTRGINTCEKYKLLWKVQAGQLENVRADED